MTQPMAISPLRAPRTRKWRARDLPGLVLILIVVKVYQRHEAAPSPRAGD